MTKTEAYVAVAGGVTDTQITNPITLEATDTKRGVIEPISAGIGVKSVALLTKETALSQHLGPSWCSWLSSTLRSRGTQILCCTAQMRAYPGKSISSTLPLSGESLLHFTYFS